MNLHDPEMIQKYRNVFSTGQGQAVLTHMLKQFGFFDYCRPDSIEQATMKNTSIWLLEQLGIFSDGNREAIVKKLLAVPVEVTKENA